MLEIITDGFCIEFISGLVIGSCIVAVSAGMAAVIWLEPKKGGEKSETK